MVAFYEIYCTSLYFINFVTYISYPFVLMSWFWLVHMTTGIEVQFPCALQRSFSWDLDENIRGKQRLPSTTVVTRRSGGRKSEWKQRARNGCNTELVSLQYIDGLLQERRNSSANTLELRFSCTKPYNLHILTFYNGRVLFWYTWSV